MPHDHINLAFHGVLSQMSGEDMDMASYVGLLGSHDWFFQYSDDSQAYRKGVNSYSKLLGYRARLDPDWAIWNSKCPAEFLVKTPT